MTYKALEDFHGDGVYRDQDGVIWVPITHVIENVKGGVCLVCGDGVLNNGEHIDPERHAREQIKALIAPFLDRAMGHHGDGEDVSDELADALIALLEPVSVVPGSVVPPELCGESEGKSGHCVFLKLHEGKHSWQPDDQ